MHIFFFSTSEDFSSYHRKREVEAISEKLDGGCTFFNRPRFFLGSRNNKNALAKSSSKVTEQELYTLLPLSIAFKHSLLLFLFVKLPILCQLTLYRMKNDISQSSLFHWIYKPDQFLYLPTDNLVYLQYDNYKDDKGYFYGRNERFDETVEQCINTSLVSLFTSNRLLQQENVKRNHSFYYPNAISRSLINQNVPNNIVVKDSVTIGFIGQIDNSFSSEILELIATQYPQYQIVLVGPVSNAKAQEVIDSHSNIIEKGYVPYEELSELISTFDIGICPYSFDTFNTYRNPLKVYEFFSYGLPVVCTNCDVDENTKGYLSVTSSVDEFIQKISYELTTNTAAKKHFRINFAKNNCWDNRADFVIQKLKAFT
ncbi:glycosyltransferase [Shewanella japonica]|uniref:glycosyltransferase n=1 Tax=Shewanella japonica TaxID=93973 RepID=UPI000E76A823|nr:glycosyltransferase [Shewanella japonica]